MCNTCSLCIERVFKSEEMGEICVSKVSALLRMRVLK